MTELAVLVSGAGTNLKAMIERGVPITVVLAERPCPALGIAEAAGLPTITVERRRFGYRKGVGDNWNRMPFTRTVLAELAKWQIDLVALAGFATIFDPVFFEQHAGRVLNTHPSLLPAFRGRGEDAVLGALEAGLAETGCTVHIVTQEVDDPRFIVSRATVEILPGDTVETLWERIKEVERQLYPSVIMRILRGSINLEEIYKV